MPLSGMHLVAESSETDASPGFRKPRQPELAIKIDDLFLTVRARNVLKRANIEYVGDLIQLTEAQLFAFQNCGRKTVEELRESLAELGLSFGMTLDKWSQPPSPAAAPDSLVHQTAQEALDENGRTRLYLRVDEIGLSQRARHVLKTCNIEFVGDLVGKTELQVRKMASCGRVTLAEIKSKLDEFGLRLGLAISGWNTQAARKTRDQQDMDPQSPIAVLRRGLNPIPPSEFLEDELRAILSAVADHRNADMISKQLGWSGEGQRTLESVAQEYSLTRERVRQIVTQKTEKLRKKYIETPRLDKALAVIRNRCPATPAELAAELRARGVSKTDFDPSGLEAACDILHKDFGLKRIPVAQTKVYVAPARVEQIGAFFRICRRLTSSQGCANFEAACDDLRIAESERQQFRKLATVGGMCEWLDSDRQWLFSTGVPRSRLSNLVAKVLCVAPRVHLTELRRAVARSRRLAVVPPLGVLAKFVERFQLASVSGDAVLAAVDCSHAVAPGSIECVLVSVLKRHGPILGWDRFQELCVAEGMNPITFGIYVSGSPIIARVTRGIYSLIGADVPPGAVEDLEREAARSRRRAEWGWSPRHTLWYALPVTGTVLAAGSAPITQFVADSAEGEWVAYLDGRELDGTVKCSNRFLWGLRRPLVNAGAEAGDVAIFEFDTSKRTVNITLGGEELADMWESGDINLPLPEPGETEACRLE